MSNCLEQKSCSIHNQSCVAINIAQSANADDLFLCVKCMADKLSLNNAVLLNEEAILILREMKLKEFESQKTEIEQSIQRYQTFITKIQDFIDQQNGCLNKIIIQFNSEIENLQSKLQSITEVEDLQESDLLVLQQNLNEQKSSNSQQTKEIKQERIKELYILIEKQLQGLKQEDKMQQIFDYFNEIINEKVMDKVQDASKIENQISSKKTPFLEYECSKHGKEIIMLTLDENYQGERILCIDCIPKCQYEMITLEDANKLWLTYQGELYDNENKFQREKEQKYCESQKIMLRFQKDYQQLQNEIIQLIESQNKEIQNQIQELQKNNKKQSLMQLELKDLKATINQLSQQDKFYQQKQQQMKMMNIDQKNQKEIVKKLSEMEQLQKDCKLELLKLFDDNDSFYYDIQIQQEQIQNQLLNSQLNSNIFTNLIPKFQNELLQNLLVQMKGLRDKGYQYIEQLNNADSKIKNKDQEQMNIHNYLNALTQFDRQYKIFTNEIDKQDHSTQTGLNLQIDTGIININEQIGEIAQLSINTIDIQQIKYQINKYGLKDQLIQTDNNKLLIDSQIIRNPERIKKIINFSVNQIKEHRFYYYNSSNYGRLLNFSQNLKHSSITISADGKKSAKLTRADGAWYFYLCDQPIPKYGTVGVDFKVKYSKYHCCISAGVCLIDQIKKSYVNLFGINNGYILITIQMLYLIFAQWWLYLFPS